MKSGIMPKAFPSWDLSFAMAESSSESAHKTVEIPEIRPLESGGLMRACFRHPS
jgi:hypothetical protein